MKKTENGAGTGVYISSDFYRDSYDYYSVKFMDMPAPSWNWCAFIFGYTWFAYRKMYLYALIFGLIDAVCSAFTVIMPELAPFIGAFLVVVNFVAGLFGNALYYLHVKKLSAKMSDMSKSEARDFVRKNGGSSVPAAIIFSIIISALVTFSDVIAELFFVV